jgi:alkylation response protein AidB-like acyl-CoA dehydrogenase
MKFLADEREVFQSFFPGLERELRSVPFGQLESPASPAIEIFRRAGAPGLLIPREHGGMGADASDAIRIQRMIGSSAPSLAVATTMHHFSAATLVELWKRERGLEWMLLQGIAEQNALLASGFAEGISGRGVFEPTMRGRRADGKVHISGSKKPCSLSRSMDILTASVLVSGEDPNAEDEICIALISTDLPGIKVAPYWQATVLAGAENNAVTLDDVHVEDALVISLGSANDPRLSVIQMAGFLWFELLITSSYIGIASALVERVLLGQRGDPWSRIAGAVELEAAMTSLDSIARQITLGNANQAGLLQKVLICRYAAQDAIGRAVASAVEMLGGTAFINDECIGYIAAASHALAFHPPGRPKIAGALADAFCGAELNIA